jgi:hypothetical protein
MRKVLKKSMNDLELEIYFYCLGMIPPISQMMGNGMKQQ